MKGAFFLFTAMGVAGLGLVAERAPRVIEQFSTPERPAPVVVKEGLEAVTGAWVREQLAALQAPVAHRHAEAQVVPAAPAVEPAVVRVVVSAWSEHGTVLVRFDDGSCAMLIESGEWIQLGRTDK